ncbi:MAG TPA: hypothetical protein PLV00_05395 [Caldisericia bacterium]|nr:hypothetical protein [Caldisericia bacterium]
MINPKSSNIGNPIQCFSKAFMQLLARIENVLFLSIPVNLLKVVIFVGLTSILPRLVDNAIVGIFLLVIIFIAIYFINSYISFIYTIFLLNKDSSLSQAVVKVKSSYRRVLSSELFFLGISSLVYVPIIAYSNFLQSASFSQEVPISTISISIYGIFATLWFCFFYIPYQSSIRMFLLHDSDPRLVIWERGYQMYWRNFFTIFGFYACFGLLYSFLTYRLSNYLYFEILMMIMIPFHASLNAVSYDTLAHMYGSNFGSRNPDKGS